MSILITGGAGFIGSHVADTLLQRGKQVVVLDNFDDYYNPELKRKNVAHNIDNPNYKLYGGDICDSYILEKVFSENNVEVVVHLAACAGVRNSFKNPLKYIKVNIEGTTNILNIMKNKGVKKLVFASSSSVYGNCEGNVFTEDLEGLKPISPYAVTKLAGEQIIYVYSRTYGINTTCLRFFTVYGPRQRPDLAVRKFSECIKKEEPITLYGDGSSTRDYTYVSDVVNGIELAMNYNKTPYEIINIGSGNPVSLNRMVKCIEDAIGKKAIINYKSMPEGDVLRTHASLEKAEKLLGYSPKVSFSNGVLSCIGSL